LCALDDQSVALLEEFTADPEPLVSQSCEVALSMLKFERSGKSFEVYTIEYMHIFASMFVDTTFFLLDAVSVHANSNCALNVFPRYCQNIYNRRSGWMRIDEETQTKAVTYKEIVEFFTYNC